MIIVRRKQREVEGLKNLQKQPPTALKGAFQVRVAPAPARARAGKARRPPFRPCHANARRSRLGRGHQYACGPFPSRSQLLSPSAMSGLPKPSMSR